MQPTETSRSSITSSPSEASTSATTCNPLEQENYAGSGQEYICFADQGNPEETEDRFQSLHDEQDYESSSSNDDSSDDMEYDFAEYISSSVKSLAFELHLKSVPEIHTSEILDSVSLLTENIFENVISLAKQGDCSQDTISNIELLQSETEKAFKKVRSPYKRKKLIENIKTYVMPKEIGLGSDGSLDPKQLTYAYIPILETLNVILQNEHTFAAIFQDTTKEASDNQIIQKYSDASNYKNKLPQHFRVKTMYVTGSGGKIMTTNLTLFF
ncbi:hypothetical protein DMENIID0001_119730 [Sergentomyia squamirostris]